MDDAYQAQLGVAQLFFANHWLSHARQKCLEIIQQGSGLSGQAADLLQRIEMRSAEPGAINLSHEHTPITVLLEQGCIISTLHFRKHDDVFLKKEAFKQGVCYIDTETSSQCNRVCSYCPNSYNDRLSSNQFINDSTYTSVVNDLHSIDYSKELRFVGYNEPLLHFDNILGRIALARRLLPRARIVVFTNGDPLKKDGLDQLIAVGVDELIISVHLPVNKAYSDDSIISRINKIAKRLATPIVPLSYTKDAHISVRLVHPGINILARQTDYENLGSNRAGTLENVGQDIETRTAACLKPIYHFVIGHLGTVVPCCAMVTDDPRNAKHAIGQVGPSKTIFDAYGSAKLIGWRRGLFNLEPKLAPCNKCTADIAMPLLNAPGLYASAQHLVSPAIQEPVFALTA